MPTNTQNLNLVGYNTTTDSQSKFLTFRNDIAGTVNSNNTKIDAWAGQVNKKLTQLEDVEPNVMVNATWVSTGYYEATVAKITSYKLDTIITFRPSQDNDGTTILKINGLDVKSLMKYDNVGGLKNLDPRDLRKNHEYQFRYDGTSWVWQGGSSADQTNIVGDVDNLIMIDSHNNLVDSGIDAKDILVYTQEEIITPIKNDADTLQGYDSAYFKKLTTDHDVSNTSHQDIRALITNEATARQSADTSLNGQITVLSTDKANKANPQFTGTATLNAKNIATNEVVDLSPYLKNGWVVFGSGHTKILAVKIGGAVIINAVMKGGAVADGTVLLTLPTGFIPSYIQTSRLVVDKTKDNGARCNISTNGDILLYGISTISTSDYLVISINYCL